LVLMALAVDSVADSTEGPHATEAKEEPGFTTRRRKRRRGGRRGEGKEAGASWCCERRLLLVWWVRDQATPAKKR
jgi:hypothetical protein